MRPEDRLTLAYVRAHPVEAARRLESLPAEEAAAILAPLPAEDVASVLEHVLPAPAASVLQHLPREEALEVMVSLSSPSSLSILRHLEGEVRAQFLDRLEKTHGASVRPALTYPDRTAGSLADPRILTLPPDITAQEALARIRREFRNATYYLYVIDRDTKLTGVVTTKELLAADPQCPVASIMTSEVVTLFAEASVEELLQHPQWRLYHTMPVVDPQGTFLGALRYQTLRRIEEEATVWQNPLSLSHALVKLWEFYSVTGIRIMTDLAEAISVGAGMEEADARKEKPDGEGRHDATPHRPRSLL